MKYVGFIGYGICADADFRKWHECKKFFDDCEADDAYCWCRDHVSEGRYGSVQVPGTDKHKYYFEDEADYLLFCLRWAA